MRNLDGLPIVGQVYEWYQANLPRYRDSGVVCDIKPPLLYPGGPVTALPEFFSCRGNVTHVFLWEAGHLEVHVFHGVGGDAFVKYHLVESGVEACSIIECYLDELVNLPPAKPFPPFGGQIDGHMP